MPIAKPPKYIVRFPDNPWSTAVTNPVAAYLTVIGTNYSTMISISSYVMFLGNRGGVYNRPMHSPASGCSRILPW